ncbi:MAG: VOC family protein [Phycisphaerae bacterium]
MKIEHVALNVPDARAMAAWYIQHLGLEVVRQGGPPVWGHFMADAGGQAIVEIYTNTKAVIPDYFAVDSLNFHLAFVSEDVPADRARIIAAGATPVGEIEHLASGDEVATLRDPWGVPIQFARRKTPML